MSEWKFPRSHSLSLFSHQFTQEGNRIRRRIFERVNKLCKVVHFAAFRIPLRKRLTPRHVRSTRNVASTRGNSVSTFFYRSTTEVYVFIWVLLTILPIDGYPGRFNSEWEQPRCWVPTLSYRRWGKLPGRSVQWTSEPEKNKPRQSPQEDIFLRQTIRYISINIYTSTLLLRVAHRPNTRTSIKRNHPQQKDKTKLNETKQQQPLSSSQSNFHFYKYN